MIRRPGRLLSVTLLLAAASSTPATAAGELGLSVDQVHWSSTISTPLFDDSMRWVPGDSENATFFIRNQGGSTGVLTIDILGSSVGDLIDSGDLHITAKGGGGEWTSVSASGRRRLLTAPDVADGRVVPILVDVSFDSTSDNQTQVRSSALAFLVTLTESVPGDGTGTLPGTGAPEVCFFAALSAILLGTGLSFVTRRSEPKREVHDV